MEAMPDIDRERGRRQAFPRIAARVIAAFDESARSEEMPDTFGSDLVRKG